MTKNGNVVDANKMPIGEVHEGDLFVLLNESVHVDYRRYGTVGEDGLTGYVLMDRLMLVDRVCG